MNGWDLLEAAGGIDPAYLTEAEATAIRTKAVKKRRRTAALAACIAVAAACAALLTLRNLPDATPGTTRDEEAGAACETPTAGENAPETGETKQAVSVAQTVTDRASDAPATEQTSGGKPAERTSASSVTEDADLPTAERTSSAYQPTEPAGAVIPSESAPENASLPDGMSGAPEPSGQSSGEDTFGGPPLPTEWSADPPVIRGTGYTEAEIAALLGREGYAVKQMVASETGYAPEELRICAAGYCHTVLGATNEVDLDYLTLPMCAGERVVASMDLFRVDGDIHYSVSAGGPRWDNLNRALQYGEVAFVYAGFGELAAAADGTVFDVTVGASETVAGQRDLYRRAAAPQTLYSLSRLRAAEKF